MKAYIERPIGEFDGAALHWLLIAEPIFKAKHIEPAHYNIRVVELDQLVEVFLTMPSREPGTRGSSGKYLDFVVEIDRSSGLVTRSSFQR